MYYKVKEDGKFITHCVYNILGINIEVKKEVISCYTNESVGAIFWLKVLI